MSARKPLSTVCRSLLATASVVALGACATGPRPDAEWLARPLTVQLVPVSLAEPDSVRQVVAPDHPKEDSAASAQVQQAMVSAQTQAVNDMRSALASVPNLHLNSALLNLPGDAANFPILARSQAFSPAALTQLRARCDADALLRIGISDYGLTPKAWRNGVITFEVLSTLGIAAIAYARPATRAIAGIYLAQETVEESLEAYSGFWALDEVYRPVRVEAELIDLRSGQRLWADSETGFSDRRLSRIYTSVTPAERLAQLHDALRRAIDKLAHDFLQPAGQPAALARPQARSTAASPGT